MNTPAVNHNRPTVTYYIDDNALYFMSKTAAHSMLNDRQQLPTTKHFKKSNQYHIIIIIIIIII